jgi:soluble lytic murein transglycosylase-like protein
VTLRGVALAGALLLAAGPAAAAEDLAGAVDAAAAAADLPRSWISAVIAVESGGDPAAVSRAGARGLMQLMPDTWSDLRAELGLGADPFDVRDNVLAGAVYLRRLLDRFGPEGAFAAYNAGPQRYADHLAGRAGLPAETRAYVGRVRSALGAVRPLRAAAGSAWARSPLFPGQGSSSLAP